MSNSAARNGWLLLAVIVLPMVFAVCLGLHYQRPSYTWERKIDGYWQATVYCKDGQITYTPKVWEQGDGTVTVNMGYRSPPFPTFTSLEAAKRFAERHTACME
jgi:hypothetical protein